MCAGVDKKDAAESSLVTEEAATGRIKVIKISALLRREEHDS